jgi:hypothetical protein
MHMPHRSARMRSRFVAAVLVIVWTQCSQVNGDGGCTSGTNNDAPVSAAAPPDTRQQRTLEKWLDALSLAESGNRARIAHQDLDGRYYYGCLQFRVKTFRFFVDRFGLTPNPAGSDFMDLIYDCGFQKRLAVRMILDNPENWKHWRGTVQRIGLPPGPNSASDLPRTARSDHSCRADNRTPGDR